VDDGLTRAGTTAGTVLTISGHTPVISPTAWIAPTAVLIGEVYVREGASVWFGAIARGDIERIDIGRGAVVQDGVILHTDAGHPLEIGAEAVIGHAAIVHGCRVESGCLIGMGATNLTGALIATGSIVAAGAVVLEGFEVPAQTLVAGVPARIVGNADSSLAKAAADRYSVRARLYAKALEHQPEQ
jgi:carbonic anhydrase/acetyltransferase-like protein (isoleucine patch superfamily)